MAKFYVTISETTVTSDAEKKLKTAFPNAKVDSKKLEAALTDGIKAGLSGASDFSTTTKSAKQIDIKATVKNFVVDDKSKPPKLTAVLELKATLLGGTLQSVTIPAKGIVLDYDAKRIEGDAVAAVQGGATDGIKKQLVPHAKQNW